MGMSSFKRDERAGGHVAPLLYHFSVVPDAVLCIDFIYTYKWGDSADGWEGNGDGHGDDDWQDWIIT